MNTTHIRDLAVAYAGFLEAMRNPSRVARSVWGGMLIQAQERTGCELLAPDFLRECIETAQQSFVYAKEMGYAERTH
jgi:hypothetical protein